MYTDVENIICRKGTPYAKIFPMTHDTLFELDIDTAPSSLPRDRALENTILTHVRTHARFAHDTCGARASCVCMCVFWGEGE